MLQAGASTARLLPWAGGRVSTLSLATPKGTVIDVLVRPEVTFDELQADAVRVDLFNRTLKIASIEHLLFMKRIANRPKDRVDIEALEKIQRGEDPYV